LQQHLLSQRGTKTHRWKRTTMTILRAAARARRKEDEEEAEDANPQPQQEVQQLQDKVSELEAVLGEVEDTLCATEKQFWQVQAANTLLEAEVRDLKKQLASTSAKKAEEGVEEENRDLKEQQVNT
jgi:predicted metalloendopeptidase